MRAHGLCHFTLAGKYLNEIQFHIGKHRPPRHFLSERLLDRLDAAQPHGLAFANIPFGPTGARSLLGVIEIEDRRLGEEIGRAEAGAALPVTATCARCACPVTYAVCCSSMASPSSPSGENMSRSSTTRAMLFAPGRKSCAKPSIVPLAWPFPAGPRHPHR
jgi:hypothetical protein